MKQVQTALRGLIDAYEGAYKATGTKAPERYVIYTTMTIETDHSDDAAQTLQTYVYMNLWDSGDPTAMAKKIRRAMKAAGFVMDEERTGNSSVSDGYESGTEMYCVNWTWVYRECLDDEY